MKKPLLLVSALLFSIIAWSQSGDLIFLTVNVDNNAGQELPFTIDIIDTTGTTTLSAVTQPDGSYYEDFYTPDNDWWHIYVHMPLCNGQVATSHHFNQGDAPPHHLFSSFDYCPDSAVYGCTDPEALNYQPDATIDDGSCIYETDCAHTEATLIIHTDQWASEMSWNITLGGAEVYGGGNYENDSDYEIPLCLQDTCYSFEMFDSFGDGWNGGEFEILIDGEVIASGGLTMGGYGQVSFGVNVDGCENVIYGCTDPDAFNFEPAATIDDGSCMYPPANDLCENATPLTPGIITIDNTHAVQNEGIWGDCWNYGGGEGEQSSIWFSFTTPDSIAEIDIQAFGDGTYTLTDTQFGIFSECGGEMLYCDGNGGDGLFSAFHFACGELEPSETYLLMIDGWYGDAGTCYLSYSASTGCEPPVYGCTDPEAINFNPEATVDDGSCEYDNECTDVTLVIDGPSAWAGYWELWTQNALVDSGYYSGSDSQYPMCLVDGCYDLTLTMPVSDTTISWVATLWHDGNIIGGGDFFGEHSTIEFGIGGGCDSTGTIYGCTDPEAINYNPAATVDDGSCEYEADCDLTQATLVIHTDNWAGEISWNLLLGDNEVYGGSGYQNDTDYEIPLCLHDSCYTFEMFDSYGDGWNGGEFEIFVDGVVIASGGLTSGDYGQVIFGVNIDGCEGPIYGCTDPEALNYNPDATVDDGSCQYEFGCEINFTVLPDSLGENTIWIIPSANIFNATEVEWDFGDGTTSTELFPQHQYPDEGPYTLCLSATFEDAIGSFCQIEYCVELTAEMIGSGLMSSGFMINVIEPITVSASDISANFNLDIHPNPTTGMATLRYDYDGEVQLRIFDVRGRLIDAPTSPRATDEIGIDLTGQEPGVYLIQLSTAHGMAHTKLIKQ